MNPPPLYSHVLLLNVSWCRYYSFNSQHPHPKQKFWPEVLNIILSLDNMTRMEWSGATQQWLSTNQQVKTKHPVPRLLPENVVLPVDWNAMQWLTRLMKVTISVSSKHWAFVPPYSKQDQPVTVMPMPTLTSSVLGTTSNCKTIIQLRSRHNQHGNFPRVWCSKMKPFIIFIKVIVTAITLGFPLFPFASK